MTDGRNRVINEKIEETELILETIRNLPDKRKVLREVEGRLIPHTMYFFQKNSLTSLTKFIIVFKVFIGQIKPALQAHLTSLKNNQK